MQTRENYRANTTKISIKLEREGGKERERGGGEMEEGKVEWESDIAFSLSLSPSYRVNESHVFHFIPIVSSRLQYTCLFSVTRERNSLLSKFLSVLRVNCGEISRSMRCVLLFPAEISRGTRKNW